MKLLKEACVENFDQGYYAFREGADRIELCDNLAAGGTTPSYATIAAAREFISIPSAVIIRARGGNFEYSDMEKNIMLQDAQMAHDLGIAGLVVGALKNSELDVEFLQQCRDIAKNCEIVCHMAFDDTKNLSESLNTLIKLGYDRVLTKGGSGKASENITVLKQLVQHAGNKITILVGGGVTKDNYLDLARETGAIEFHGRKII